MKEKELKEISNAFQQTTGGKWVSHEKFPGSIAREFEIRTDTGGTLFRSTSYGNMDHDAAFIELSHNKMPELIAEIVRLRDSLEVIADVCAILQPAITRKARATLEGE